MKLKKFISIFSAAAMVLSQGISAFAMDSGSASASDPYKISSEADFLEIAKDPDASYTLTRDITLSSFDPVDFSGTLDGNGHKITSSDADPLFLNVSGTVKNLGVEVSNVEGANAGIIAKTLTGTIESCMTKGNVKSSEEYGGGIAGRVENGKISNSYSTAKVSGAKNTGGIAGSLSGAELSGCYADSKVSSSGGSAGGIAGSSSDSTVTNCYYSSNSGSTFGIVEGSDSTVRLSSEQMTEQSSFAGFDFNNTWIIIDGKTPMLAVYNGRGTQEKPYLLHDRDDVDDILRPNCTDASKYYKLAGNISMDMVGDDNNRFMGHLDGSGMYVKLSSSMFGAIGEGAEVKNITAPNVSPISPNLGGYIAQINYGTIDGCYVSGANVSARKDAGGIAGENIGGTISNCFYNGSVKVSQSGAGGIAGYNSYGTIENCGVTGNISSASDAHSIGGIAGDNSNGVISNCYFIGGSVWGGSEVGGVAGRLYNGTVKTSYADASVSGQENIGPVIGSVVESGNVENTYFNNAKFTEDENTDYKGTAIDNMNSKSSYGGFDFNSVWTIEEGNYSPKLIAVNGAGTRTSPYLVRSSYDISMIQDFRRLYYKQCNDIPYMNDNVSSFSGSYDGGGYVINSITANVFSKINSGAYVGNTHVSGGYLAGGIEGAVVEYCTVGNSEGLIREITNSTVRNCAAFDINNASGTISGGFADSIKDSEISDSRVSNANVSASTAAGGFAGSINNSKISGCYADGITVKSDTAAGGFVGRNDNNSVVSDCVCAANVSGSGKSGVFVGMNYAQITNCEAYGGLTSSDTDGQSKYYGDFTGTEEGKTDNCNTDYVIGNYEGKILMTGGINTKLSIPELAADETPDNDNPSGVVLTDISGHWAEQTILNLVSQGVVSGYEDSTFRPQNGVTKGEFIKLLLTATKTNIIKNNFSDYEDVNKSWAKDYVITAISLGICDNISDSSTNFGVDDKITRAEAAALMGRLLASGTKGTPSFTDSADIPAWASDAVYATVQLGIITGMEDGSFAPANNLTRAESATIIERIMNLK